MEPGASAVSGKSAGKSRALFSTELPASKYAEGPFSLRRGLDCGRSFSSWASPFSFSMVYGGKTTRATLSDRPRSSSYAAKQLGRIPPGEGWGVIGPALAGDRRRREGQRRGMGRFGEERVGIDRHRHGVIEVHLRRNSRCPQGYFRISSSLFDNAL